jgi:hypothetical protein
MKIDLKVGDVFRMDEPIMAREQPGLNQSKDDLLIGIRISTVKVRGIDLEAYRDNYRLEVIESTGNDPHPANKVLRLTTDYVNGLNKKLCPSIEKPNDETPKC